MTGPTGTVEPSPHSTVQVMSFSVKAPDTELAWRYEP
jgi:hypothetical protein